MSLPMTPSIISSSCRGHCPLSAGLMLSSALFPRRGPFLFRRLLPTRSSELERQIRFDHKSSTLKSFQPPCCRFSSRELPTESSSRLFNCTSLPVVASSSRLSRELPIVSSMRFFKIEPLFCGIGLFSSELPMVSNIRFRMRLLPTRSRTRLSADGGRPSASAVRQRFFSSELPTESNMRLLSRGVHLDSTAWSRSCARLEQNNTS